MSCPRGCSRQGCTTRWRSCGPDAIETLTALGELEQAGAYLEQYEDNARRAQSPWAVAAASRCRGLLAAKTR